MQSKGPVIRARKLTKQFGEEVAVRDVTFEIPHGQIFGFIGPSGSGKTTTIRLLTGYHAPTSGEVMVLGDSPAHFRIETKYKIGYMPQLFALYPELTVSENVHFSASLYGMGWFRRKRLKQLLDFVELTRHRRKKVAQISGGMQRRLSLAATLVHDPQLIFLDEPTAGIDPVLRRKFWDYFRELHHQGKTLFVTTQYVSEAAYCDLIGIMSEGKLLMVDTPAGLRNRAFSGDIVELQADQKMTPLQIAELDLLPFVRRTIARLPNGTVRLAVKDAATAIPELMEWCRQNRIVVNSIEEYAPPFDDVFVELLKGERRYG